MSLDLNTYTTELTTRDGLFYAKDTSRVSYPESGNDMYFRIEEASFWFQHRNQCICEAVKMYSAGNVFFDVGGGNGFVSRALEEGGVATVLLEPGLAGCLNAKGRGLKNIICSTWEDAHFKNDSLPAVGLFDVVEHIKDDVSFLTSVYHSLREDGLVFITVPAFQLLWSNEDVEAGHFRRYTPAKLVAILTGIGFEAEYATCLFSMLPFPIFLFRTIPSLVGLHNKPGNMDKKKNEHKNRHGIQARLLNKLSQWELNKIKKGAAISFGSTCFVVARKKK